VSDHQISILSGSAFVVSDGLGDIESAVGNPNGLFYRDMRHLSRWQLRLNGRQLSAMSARTLEYDEAVFFLVEPTGTIYRNPAMSLIRRREVSEGMHEHLELHNHGLRRIDVELSLLFDADFADLFEVKDDLAKTGELYRHPEHDGVTLGYLRGDFRRETYINAPGAWFTEQSLTFRVGLEPRESWSATVVVRVGTARDEPRPQLMHRPEMPDSLAEWLAAAPKVDTDWHDLRQVYRRSLIDLAALRFYPESVPDSSLPAAGLPWFMALFGRDSLITSYQAIPFVPRCSRLARTRRPTGMTSATPSPARSCTSCVTASSPTSASDRTRRTSGRPTRRRCSWSCSTSTSAGPATPKRSASSKARPGPR